MKKTSQWSGCLWSYCIACIQTYILIYCAVKSKSGQDYEWLSVLGRFMFKSGSQIVPGEHKCGEKDVLDHSVLCGSQPAPWVSTTVSWLLPIIAYWCHLGGMGDSPFFASLNLSFMVGLMTDVSQRCSVRMPAVMTAAGEGAVNCSKLCNWLFKRGDGGNTQSYLRSLSKLCWSILSLFHGVFVATALFLESLFWTSHWKRKVQNISVSFIVLRKLLTVALHAFTCHTEVWNTWKIQGIWKYLILLKLVHQNLSLVFPGKVRLERNWKSRRSLMWGCYSNLQYFHSSWCVLLNLYLLFFLGQCRSFCSLTLCAWHRWAIFQLTVFSGAPRGNTKQQLETLGLSLAVVPLLSLDLVRIQGRRGWM